MWFNRVRCLLVVALLPVMLVACNGSGGGSTNSSGTTTPAGLVLTNANSDGDVVLGGTYKYYVSLADAKKTSKPIHLNITSSNTYVGAIESNTCSTLSSNTSDTSSATCSFFVRGNSIGQTIITISGDDNSQLTETLNILRRWGTFGSVHPSYVISQLAFAGDYIYALDNKGSETSVLKTNGTLWQQVGYGGVMTDVYSNNATITADNSHVCVGLTYNASNVYSGEVKCSFNDSAWQTLPIIDRYAITKINLYRGNLYVLLYDQFQVVVKYCPIDSCNQWQTTDAKTLETSYMVGGTFYNSTPYILDNGGVYRLNVESTGTWESYGSYKNYGTAYTYSVIVSQVGAAIMPLHYQTADILYLQRVLYSNVEGGMFALVGGLIPVEESKMNNPNPLAMNDKNILVSPGDGNVYISTNIGNIWLPWSKLGNNNPELNDVYVHNNKVYSILYLNPYTTGGSQIYVYSLDSAL